ncbi:MAG TPA: alpha/beta hydrolase [Gemmatimonadales bacterium]
MLHYLIGLAVLAAPVDSIAVRDIQVAKGETLRITSMGIGKPVVLIPGLFGGAYSYRKITAPLVAQGYRAIVVEPLGYGASSHPKKADYSLDAQADRVARTLDHLGIRRALLISHANGSGIGFRLAVDRPDLVRGLLSIDGGPAETAATAELRRVFRLGAFPVKLILDPARARYELKDELASSSGNRTWVTDEVVRKYSAPQIRDLNGSIDALSQMAKAKEKGSLAERLSQCGVPVVLLVGTSPHRAMVSPEERDLLQQRVKRVEIEDIPGAGRYIQEEQPQVVLDAVARLNQMAG